MSYKKTAKDLAFDKERDTYKKQIRELSESLTKRTLESGVASDYIHALESKNRELQDWVDRLLELVDLPKEEVELLVTKVKKRREIDRTAAMINCMISGMGLFPYQKQMMSDIFNMYPKPREIPIVVHNPDQIKNVESIYPQSLLSGFDTHLVIADELNKEMKKV